MKTERDSIGSGTEEDDSRITEIQMKHRFKNVKYWLSN